MRSRRRWRTTSPRRRRTSRHGVQSASFDTASQAQPRTSGGGGGGGGPPPVPIPSEVEFEWNVTRDIEALDGGNDLPTGLWSDGETLWVLENAASGPDRLFAYDLDSGERQSEREFELDRRNRFAHGIWSDGETVWIADSGQDQLFAYELASGERLEERDIELHEDNRDPRGIWSDGETLYVLDSVKDALFAYELESGELLAEYPLDQLNRSPRGLWSDGVTLWVSDDGAKRLFAYRIEGGVLVRHEHLEFTFRSLLKAGNGAARGIWSDADVIFVADEQDDRVYTYNMPDALDARLAALSLSGLSLAEFSPQRTEYRVTAAAALGRTTIEVKPEHDQARVEIEPDDIDADPQNGHQVERARRSADHGQGQLRRCQPLAALPGPHPALPDGSDRGAAEHGPLRRRQRRRAPGLRPQPRLRRALSPARGRLGRLVPGWTRVNQRLLPPALQRRPARRPAAGRQARTDLTCRSAQGQRRPPWRSNRAHNAETVGPSNQRAHQ